MANIAELVAEIDKKSIELEKIRICKLIAERIINSESLEVKLELTKLLNEL